MRRLPTDFSQIARTFAVFIGSQPVTNQVLLGHPLSLQVFINAPLEKQVLLAFQELVMERSKSNLTAAEATCALAAVTLTCRSRPHVAALSHVIASIDSYVNRIETKWTLERASMYKCMNLMDRFGKLEWGGVTNAFRKKRFLNGITEARKYNNMKALKWWMTIYLPDHDFAISEIQKCVIESDANERIAMLKWLQAQGKLTLTNQQSAFEVKSGYDNLAVWLHENVQGIKMKLKMTYDNSSLDDIKWAFAHQDLYEIEGVVEFMYKVIRQGYPAECLPWLLEISSERLHSSLFNNLMHKVYNVDLFKLPYDAYRKNYFDDPAYPSTCLKLIQWFLTAYEWKDEKARVAWIVRCMEEAAYCCNGLGIIEYLYTVHPETDTGEAMENAAWSGCLDILQYLHARRANTTGAMYRAAQRGKLEALKWLHEQKIGGCTRAMDGAAARNQLSTIQWLHENRSEGCTPKAMSFALQQGHLEVVQWLHENRPEGCLPSDMDSLAAKNKLKMVQWMHESRSEGCTTDAMDKAAAYGYLEIVQFLHNNRTEGCTTKAMDEAASKGHLKMVEWLHANRSEGCTTNAMDLAAGDGHLEVIQFLHANRTEGFTTRALHDAAHRNCSKVVKWLITYRPEICTTEDIANAFKVAASRGDSQLVAWLLPKVSADEITTALDDAVETNSVSVLKQLVTRCDPRYLPKALVRAASENHFALVELILKCQEQLGTPKLECPFENE